MITYAQKIQPIIECVRFIEHYVNDSVQDYRSLLQYIQNDEEKATIEELIQLGQQIGTLFIKKHNDQRFVFTYMNEDKCISLMSTMLSHACDFYITDYKEQIRKMKKFYEQDPSSLILEIIQNEKNETILPITSQENLFHLFDELIIRDDVKWNLWKAQYHILDTLSMLETVLDETMPILQGYSSFYDKWLALYHTELENANGVFYEYLAKEIGFEHSIEEGIIIPSVAGCRSITFNSCDEKNEIIIYGIGTLSRIQMDTTLSDEKLCSTLKLLSDKSKFDILRMIGKKKAYGAQIASELNLSTPTISYHMQALLNAQLISFEKSNNRLYYCLNTNFIQSFLHQVEDRLLGEQI